MVPRVDEGIKADVMAGRPSVVQYPVAQYPFLPTRLFRPEGLKRGSDVNNFFREVLGFCAWKVFLP